MITFGKSDLKLNYHPNNSKGEVDCTGYANFEYFNKFQRQPVANLINVYEMEHGLTDKAHGHSIEKMIRAHLPVKISTYEAALKWLMENLDHQTLTYKKKAS